VIFKKKKQEEEEGGYEAVSPQNAIGTFGKENN
jgi:hypothetical protein